MPDATHRSNAGVIDVLFAVALGEGFISGLGEFKNELVSGEVFGLGAASQGVYRVLLGFLIIILSWLHYRRSTLAVHDRYPTPEFVTDICVIVAYMTLFLFVDTPTAFYTTVALIWTLYVLARASLWIRNIRYLGIGLLFIGFFTVIAVTSSAFTGNTAEWTRLLLVTVAIAAYRPVDSRSVRRIEQRAVGS